MPHLRLVEGAPAAPPSHNLALAAAAAARSSYLPQRADASIWPALGGVNHVHDIRNGSASSNLAAAQTQSIQGNDASACDEATGSFGATYPGARGEPAGAPFRNPIPGPSHLATSAAAAPTTSQLPPPNALDAAYQQSPFAGPRASMLFRNRPALPGATGCGDSAEAVAVAVPSASGLGGLLTNRETERRWINEQKVKRMSASTEAAAGATSAGAAGASFSAAPAHEAGVSADGAQHARDGTGQQPQQQQQQEMLLLQISGHSSSNDSSSSSGMKAAGCNGSAAQGAGDMGGQGGGDGDGSGGRDRGCLVLPVLAELLDIQDQTGRKSSRGSGSSPPLQLEQQQQQQQHSQGLGCGTLSPPKPARSKSMRRLHVAPTRGSTSGLPPALALPLPLAQKTPGRASPAPSPMAAARDHVLLRASTGEMEAGSSGAGVGAVDGSFQPNSGPPANPPLAAGASARWRRQGPPPPILTAGLDGPCLSVASQSPQPHKKQIDGSPRVASHRYGSKIDRGGCGIDGCEEAEYGGNVLDSDGSKSFLHHDISRSLSPALRAVGPGSVVSSGFRPTAPLLSASPSSSSIATAHQPFRERPLAGIATTTTANRARTFHGYSLSPSAGTADAAGSTGAAGTQAATKGASCTAVSNSSSSAQALLSPSWTGRLSRLSEWPWARGRGGEGREGDKAVGDTPSVAVGQEFGGGRVSGFSGNGGGSASASSTPMRLRTSLYGGGVGGGVGRAAGLGVVNCRPHSVSGFEPAFLPPAVSPKAAGLRIASLLGAEAGAETGEGEDGRGGSGDGSGLICTRRRSVAPPGTGSAGGVDGVLRWRSSMAALPCIDGGSYGGSCRPLGHAGAKQGEVGGGREGRAAGGRVSPGPIPVVPSPLGAPPGPQRSRRALDAKAVGEVRAVGLS